MWRALRLALGVALAILTTQRVVLAIDTPCAEVPAKSVNAAALKPSEVSLAVSAPRAGETIVEVEPTQTVTLMIEYWGPRLVPAAEARAVDDYHLAYFLDEDATPYLGTLLPIPRCNPRIIHAAATRITFDRVERGSHALSVVLTGSNNVSVNPPVATRVWFMVR